MSGKSNYFSEELAFSVAQHPSFRKGKEYFAEGCVEKIWQEEELYKAIVKGTYLYQVSLKFDGNELAYTCSCPFEQEGACKHVVAAILAFAIDKKYVVQPARKEIEKDEIIIDNLLSNTTTNQQRLFLERILKKEPQLIEDLRIFLQGQNQTPVTILDYKTRFKCKLDQLDLKELMQMWYQEGEDYYDDQYFDFTTASLEDVVDELVSLGEKYEENENDGEALKIYQATFEALLEKQKTLPKNLSDLSDWFDQEMDKVITFYIKILVKTSDRNLKKIGINFLCFIFQYSSICISKEPLLSGLKQTIISQDEAKYTLEYLSFGGEGDLSMEESSLLAFLYFLAEDWRNFEKISLGNLKKNPSLALDLLKYYQKNNNRDKIIQTSDQVLGELAKTDEGNKEIEIQIRRFLKNIYSEVGDYSIMITNLEQLFLVTGELTGYKELVESYHDKSEKEKFWLVIKEHFDDEYKIKTVFKIFKLEDQKQEVLKLIIKYPQGDCFSEMIVFVRDSFPQECFIAYRKKIEEMLKETDVRKYAEAACHLKKMKEIGMDKEFVDFVNWIKTTYWRRRRLMEELQKNKL